MQKMLKRVLSLVLVLVLAGSMLPASHVHAEETEASGVLTDADYAIVNDVFAKIDAMEDAPAKKNANQTQLTDAAIEIVKASENYVEGSLERNGDSFTWWTDEGIRCIYNPRMREKYDNMVAPEDPLADGAYNEPVATKGGWPSGNQVYLIAPYYGIDDSFTDQYRTEATDLAEAIGDTDGYTLYSGSAATVDKVAEAISNGAVVIFDSHGTTDYTNPNDEYEYVTGAKYSYLCLTSKSGLTSEDYNDGAAYFTDSDGVMCACVNGAAIANHMKKNSPAGILWMAICLGMATNTMCEPMRAKGVEVVYGYSQSVSFAGDYLFEETFWDNMCAGKDVATSIAAMKTQWGNWDWSTKIASYYGYTDGYSTISAARYDYAAFPIVVSDEDTHPGQKTGSSNYGADSLQTVKSTYTLFSQYAVTAQSNHTAYGTVSASGSTITAVPAEGYFAESATVISGTATVTQSGNTFSVLAESDCTVQINFAPKTLVTVNFAGANVSAQTGYSGDAMNLPTAEAPEGYTFLGWMDAPLSDKTTEKPSYYTDSFIPTGNTTLYALYKYVDTTTGEGGGDYVKVTSTPDDWSGEYVIVYETGGYILDSSLATMDVSSNYKAVTITDNTIAAADADPYKFTIARMDGGYSILGTNGSYIGGTSGSNKLNASSSAQLNTIDLDASGNATIVSNTSHLRYNTTSGQYRFRYFKSSTYSNQKPVALYKKDSGTTYYLSFTTGTPVEAWNVVLQDDLNVNFHLNLNADDQVKITVETEETVYDASALEQMEDGKYVVTVSLAAAQMMDKITIQVVGEESGEPAVYTIRQYADTILNGEYDDATKQMVRDMLNYGAMAQVYFKYNAANLANADITGFGQSEVTEATYSETIYEGAVDGIRFHAASLVYGSKVAVRLYFEVLSGSIEDYTFSDGTDNLTAVASDGYYYVEFADIAPDKWDELVNLYARKGEQSIHVQYSPLSYMVRMSGKETTGENLKNLLKAMYNYHLAAKAFTA